MVDTHLFIWLLSFAGVAIVTLWFLASAYLFSPLHEIPNAGVLAPLSRLLWAFIQEHRGQVTLILPKLHEKLGPLVRIGPNECSFYSLEIYKTVNVAGSKWTKDPRVYGHFVQDGHPSLFSITDAKEHAQRRRLMGQIFNRSKMPLLEVMMLHQTARFLEAVKCHDLIVDLTPACRALESDIVSDNPMACFGFGAEIGGIAAWAQGKDLDMVVANDLKSQWIALYSNLPGLVSLWQGLELLLFHVSGWQNGTAIAMSRFDQWSSDQLEAILCGKRDTNSYPNFISTMIRSGLPTQSALSEAKEMLGPGTETTSATLAHILWALAHDQQYQTELVAEIASAGWPKDMTSLESLPRLHAAVKEGIRWTGAAAATLPRVAPPGGATLDGRYIPEGTIVSSSPIWYLHDKHAFPAPHNYRPRRWLEDASSNPLRDEYYIPFSKGANTCVGSHFAYLELYIALSQILKTFHVRLPYQDWAAMEATLPPRKEWVAAVPLVKLEVYLELRREIDEI